jgi:hypothetical protein
MERQTTGISVSGRAHAGEQLKCGTFAEGGELLVGRIGMPIDLHDYSLSIIFSVSVVVMFASSEAGRLLGVRAIGRGGDDVSTLEGAILGLLALMISFTFAMALSRYEARRDAVLTEANAIGTTALRARLLPAPHNVDINRLLQEYVRIRLDITQRVPSPTELNAAIRRSNEIQEALWQQTKLVAAKDSGMVPTGLFIQTLNEMIDNQGKLPGGVTQPRAEYCPDSALRCSCCC